MLERLNSLWVGKAFGYVERLCAVSALSLGHPFTLYSYRPDDVRDIPSGVEVRDAREIMSDRQLTRYFDTGWAALGSDFFRYHLLAKDLGYWVDMDVIFLQPLDFKGQYVFGWERPDSINGAVLRIPAKSQFANDLCTSAMKNWRPPWFGAKRSLLYYLLRLRKGNVYPDDMPWGTFGPGLITYLAKKHGVAQEAQGVEVFYPVGYFEAHKLLGRAALVEKKITPSTRAVHVWHSRIVQELGAAPPHGSYLESACRRYGI